MTGHEIAVNTFFTSVIVAIVTFVVIGIWQEASGERDPPASATPVIMAFFVSFVATCALGFGLVLEMIWVS